jgi:hypothetical protein
MVMKFLALGLMVGAALSPIVLGLIWVYCGDQQFTKGLEGLTDPKNY